MSKFLLSTKKRIRRTLKKNKKGVFLFVFIALILFFLLIINISDIFSSIITKQKSLFYNDKLEVSSFNTYAVSLYDFKTEEEAKNKTYEVEKQGGMGVVYHNGEYFVLSSCYPNLIMAQEIRDNLCLLGYNSKIINFKTNSLCFDYKGNYSQLILSSLNIFKETFLELYQINIDYDKDLLNRANVNGKVAILSLQVYDLIKGYQNIKSGLDSSKESNLLNGLNDLYQTLEDVIIYQSEEKFVFTSFFKKELYKIILLTQSVYSSFE